VAICASLFQALCVGLQAKYPPSCSSPVLLKQATEAAAAVEAAAEARSAAQQSSLVAQLEAQILETSAARTAEAAAAERARKVGCYIMCVCLCVYAARTVEAAAAERVRKVTCMCPEIRIGWYCCASQWFYWCFNHPAILLMSAKIGDTDACTF